MSGLDGLRGLAVIAVIAYHLNLSWTPGGFLGVGVFFVLSGYLITDLLVDEWSQDGKINLVNFWFHRFRRLLPAFFVMLLTVIAWVTLFERPMLAKLQEEVLPSLLYVSNWWYIFHNVSYFESFGPPSPITNIWSLAVEEQFYLIWPLLILLGLRFVKDRSKLVGITLLFAIVSALVMTIMYEPGTDPSRVYYGTDTRAFSMLFGASLALVWPSRKLSTKVPVQGRMALDLIGGIGLLIIFVMIFTTTQYDDFIYQGGMVILSLATVLLVATLAHPSSRLASVLSWKPLRWIGVRSYGIYLWHYPIIILTNPPVNTSGVNVSLAIFQIVATLVAAALSWRFIENPIRHGALARIWDSIRDRKFNWKKLSVHGKLISVAAIPIVFVSLLGMTNIIPAQSVQTNNIAVASEKQAVKQEKSEDSKGKQTKHQVQENKKVDSPKQAYKGITVIGDSIMINVAPHIQKVFPEAYVDAVIGRQMYEVPSVISGLKAKGNLGECIVLELGTNGPFKNEQIMDVIKMLEEANVKKIILVNTRVPRPWQNVVNTTLQEVASDLHHVVLADWYRASENKDGYFAPDGVHLSPTGAEAFAKLLIPMLKP